MHVTNSKFVKAPTEKKKKTDLFGFNDIKYPDLVRKFIIYYKYFKCSQKIIDEMIAANANCTNFKKLFSRIFLTQDNAFIASPSPAPSSNTSLESNGPLYPSTSGKFKSRSCTVNKSVFEILKLGFLDLFIYQFKYLKTF